MIAASLVAVAFLVGLAAKERDNRFCISCHLHDEKFVRLIAPAATDLSGAHHVKDGDVGCIACHGGAALPMRLAVWAVAGFDTVKFLAGLYREPTHMRLPLRDAECRQCHTPILRPPLPPPTRAPAEGAPAGGSAIESVYTVDPQAEGRAGTSYHAIRDHETVDVQCVRCHTSHTTDSDAASRFISRATVVPLCRECHKEM